MKIEEFETLSIIVPVYQVEMYIRECLDSILGQSFTDIELILVDDGSFDASPEIIDDYANRDKRIKVIHQLNRGVSKARNSGLDIARGTYVTFVDSDDMINSEMYEQIIRCMKTNNADIVECGVKKFTEVSEIKSLIECGENLFLNSNAEIFKKFLERNKECLAGTVWNKVYKREIFELPMKLRFKENYKTEDGEVILKILNRCEKYVYLNNPLYYYRKGRNSNITANRGNDLGLRKDAIETLLTQLEIIKKKNYKPDEIKEFLWRISKVMINSYYIIGKELKEKEEASKILPKIEPVIKMALETKLGFTRRMMLKIFEANPNLFWYIIGKWYKFYYVRSTE